MNAPCVLIVEDDVHLREALCETLELADVAVISACNGEEALAILAKRLVGLVITDLMMQPMDGHELLHRIRAEYAHIPVVIMTAYGTIEQAVVAMREGASDYMVKPFEANEIARIARRYLPVPATNGMVAEDPKTLALMDLARRAAKSNATILISGDSGTGKEVLAHYIHEQSTRASAPLIAINCAAIPENMLEALLFGYEKGAFTGAQTAHAGKFEQAQGGTLLLDEISEMNVALQAKLLRVLQEREIERLGSRRPIALDVRVIATTNRRLREEVVAGRFREDLFYRLNVFPLHIPPLRERPGDILPLARRLVARYCPTPQRVPALTDEVKASLLAQRWPGNVREMDNVIQRALILANQDHLNAADLQFEADENPLPTIAIVPAAAQPQLEQALQSSERELILEALRVDGSRVAAAKRLGISPRTLRYKLARIRALGTPLPKSRRDSCINTGAD